ncbi:MAG: glycosyltransferase family 2 protein [Planctomycetota bacterium]|nr:glycosyltransferase family 2 protein [Planctomycetota bacterium]
MKPVTVVIPTLGNSDLLEANLPALLVEFERRAVGDELLLVDDTGAGALEGWAAAYLAGKPARLLVRESNGGFAHAVETGVAAASHDLVFSMNSDLRVQPGFLEPLVEALEGPAPAGFERVFAAVPRVHLDGDPDRDEAYLRLDLSGGLLHFRDVDPGRPPTVPTPVAYAIGGTVLFDRAAFCELGGFDELFAPFYFEDTDLGWKAARRGWATLYVPDAVVEHHHRGTIGKLLSEERRRAAVERGELLFNWKHLDDADLPEHLALLFRRALDAYLTDDRQALIWLLAALDRATEVKLARDRTGRSTRELVELLKGERRSPR